MNMQSQVRVDSTGPYEARPFFFLFFLDVPPLSSPINSTIDCSPKFSPQVAMLLLTIQLFRYIMFQEMDPVFFMH